MSAESNDQVINLIMKATSQMKKILLQDKTDPGKWWCFYKQNGVSMSWSHGFTFWKILDGHLNDFGYTDEHER